MKKKLLSILLCLVMVVGLLPTAVLATDEVAINETNFPDEKFRNYVLTEFDKNSDSKLSSEEIAAVTKIEANNMGIKSLKGVGFFTALETLNCWGNELTGLDLSKNTALKELQCSNSKLQSLDLRQNKNLIRLYCGRNPLTTLDLSENTKLKVLNCRGFGNKHMELTELDLSRNTALESLDCSLNKLKELNVSGCTALVKLDCGGNQLDALDVSMNKNLIELLCSSNQLEALNVSKNTELKNLYCRDNFLAELDVSKNLKLKSISYGKNGLTSLDLDKNEKITDVNSDNQQFYNKGTLPAGGTFDMKTLPGFDPKRAIDWQGGTMDETTGILMVDADAEAVTYKYKTKSDSTDAKYLMPCKMEVRGGTTPPTTYTVSFDANGGTGTMENVTGVTSSFTLPTCTFTAPANKQFKGWATSASGTVITGTSITVSADTKLYAIWEPIPATTYTVSFDANGGTGTMADVTGISGEYTLPANGFTAPAGKQFKAWSVGGVEKAVGSTINVTANTTVTAIWEAIEYTVTVSGSYASASGAGEYAMGETVNIYAGTKSGYTFNGWTSDDVTVLSASSKNASFVMPNKAVTVKANWTYNGSGGGVTTYPITVKSAKNGDVTASHKSASKGTTVTLTVDPDKGYVLDTLTVLDGKDKEIKLTEKNGKYTFTMPASKVTVEAMFKATGNNPFIDMPAGSYYEDAVIWAVDKGITTGTSATTFTPDGICTRAQAVTFLWRAAGSPVAKSSAMPFTDVPVGSYYYDAVLWAVENGITKGTSDTTFSPDATCTRAQIVTFLWRAGGSPVASGNSDFTDVAADAYYAAAVTWAEKNGVTGGIGGGLFGSGNNCTRAQIVTFIWRCKK